MSRRKKGRAVSGVILLDKPVGLSSNHALIKVRGMFNARKAGHTGTLDPFATGMLPICLGEASKTAAFLIDSGKTYRATARLGVATESGDLTGKTVQESNVPNLSEQKIQRVLESFTGDQMQVPPMYSALKHEGKPLYEYARQGIVLERKARPVTIHRLELQNWQTPELTFEVSCSKGTYIRTLGEDIARALGTCAHLTALRRLTVEPFEESALLSLETLQAAADDGSIDELLMPADAGLPGWSVVTLDDNDLSAFSNGNPVAVAMPGNEWVRVHSKRGEPLGLGEVSDGQLQPRRVFVQP